MTGNRLMRFAAGQNQPQEPRTEQGWNVLVVDDEPTIHEVTEISLRGFTFEQQPLTFLHAYSAGEAETILRDRRDIAVILLDVVMEREHAGLDLVRVIREDHDNHMIRIVLRTGQPGIAPEYEVIQRYDINDYRDKTELAAHRLRTLMYGCLRSYRDLLHLERDRNGLRQVIGGVTRLLPEGNGDMFLAGALSEFTSLLPERSRQKVSGVAFGNVRRQLKAVAGTGAYRDEVGRTITQIFDERQTETVEAAAGAGTFIIEQGRLVAPMVGGAEPQAIYLEGLDALDATQRHMLEVFANTLGICFQNIQLRENIESAQRDLVSRLAAALEFRGHETRNHTRRVGEIAAILASAVGMPEASTSLLRQAAPLHDIGKIAVPDALLFKKGGFTKAELDLLKTHTQTGASLLAGSAHAVLQMAAQIAISHHECWDGSGYPVGTSGEQIPLAGRLTAVADTFDTLCAGDRTRTPMTHEEAAAFILDRAGRNFDPQIVQALMARLPEIKAVLERLPDPAPTADEMIF